MLRCCACATERSTRKRARNGGRMGEKCMMMMGGLFCGRGPAWEEVGAGGRGGGAVEGEWEEMRKQKSGGLLFE